MTITEAGFSGFHKQLARSSAAALSDPQKAQRRLCHWTMAGTAALRIARRSGIARGAIPEIGPSTQRGFAPSSAGAHGGATAQADIAFSPDVDETHRNGRRLSPADAPRLFAMLRVLCAKSATPVIDDVYLIDGFGVFALQTAPEAWPGLPSFMQGAEVPPRCQIVIGEGLFEALSLEELRAVLAHELGHFANGHDALGARLEALRAACLRYDGAMPEDAGSVAGAMPSAEYAGGCQHEALQGGRRCALFGASRLFAPLMRWYMRRLIAMALPLYRQAELQADQFAARLVGPAALGQALIRLAMAEARVNCPAHQIDHRRRAGQGAAADCDAELAPNGDDGLLAHLLAARSRPDDTHPSLAERLDALGLAPALPPLLRDATRASRLLVCRRSS